MLYRGIVCYSFYCYFKHCFSAQDVSERIYGNWNPWLLLVGEMGGAWVRKVDFSLDALLYTSIFKNNLKKLNKQRWDSPNFSVYQNYQLDRMESPGPVSRVETLPQRTWAGPRNLHFCMRTQKVAQMLVFVGPQGRMERRSRKDLLRSPRQVQLDFRKWKGDFRL